MRLAIGRISDGEIQYAEKICGFVRNIYRDLSLLVDKMDDNAEMKKKMEVMFQSMVKIENGKTYFLIREILVLEAGIICAFFIISLPALFSVHVRGSEYVPLLGSDDRNFSFLGMDDV